MTFENWWRSKDPADIGEIEFRLLREAWDAAQTDERERCANVCELQAVGHRDGFGNHCAALIRERPNVK